MNYNSMTDLELLHYLDLYSEDPIVRRLVDLLSNTRGAIISDLEAAGMDPDWTFETDWQRQYPGEYIEYLRRERDEAESDLEHTKYKLEEAETELDELKTRSIMDFVQEVWQEKRTATFKVQEALKEAQAQKEENDRLKREDRHVGYYESNCIYIMTVTYKAMEMFPKVQIPILHKVVYAHTFDDVPAQWQISYKDYRVNEWLKANCKHPYYHSPGYLKEKFIQFECDEEALLFALRWA